MRNKLIIALGLAASLLSASVYADDDDERHSFRFDADGFQEVPQALFTPGEARVRFRVREDQIVYRFRFRRLVGDIENSVGAHIHFGRPGINGGILAFICGTDALPGPAGTPACISNGDGSGFIEGVITAESILGIAGQGFPGGDLHAFIDVLNAGAAYLNVHTDAFPSGEVRGNLQPFEFGDDYD